MVLAARGALACRLREVALVLARFGCNNHTVCAELGCRYLRNEMLFVFKLQVYIIF